MALLTKETSAHQDCDAAADAWLRPLCSRWNWAASAMQPGGVIIADDVRSHEGFATIARRHLDYEAVVAESADAVEFFGIAVNMARPAAASS
jgi:predicted O-methyltransferase YrrM